MLWGATGRYSPSKPGSSREIISQEFGIATHVLPDMSDLKLLIFFLPFFKINFYPMHMHARLLYDSCKKITE